MTTDKNFPHTMDNCFGDDVVCDHCAAKLSGRAEVWVWNEHTACSRVCVVKAHQAGEAEYQKKMFNKIGDAIGFGDEERDVDLL